MNNDKQHLEDTKYVQWQDGMYVMLDYLDGDYEKALVEDSLRGSVYFDDACYFIKVRPDNCLGVFGGDAGLWPCSDIMSFVTKLTRAQALYISTGDVNI
jgi:hypothetical protein